MRRVVVSRTTCTPSSTCAAAAAAAAAAAVSVAVGPTRVASTFVHPWQRHGDHHRSHDKATTATTATAAAATSARRAVSWPRHRHVRSRHGGRHAAQQVVRDVAGMVVVETQLRSRRIQYERFDEQLAAAAEDVLGDDVIDVDARTTTPHTACADGAEGRDKTEEQHDNDSSAMAMTTTRRVASRPPHRAATRALGAQFDHARIQATAHHDAFCALARQAARAAVITRAAVRQAPDTTTASSASSASSLLHNTEADEVTATATWPTDAWAYVRNAAGHAATQPADTRGAHTQRSGRDGEDDGGAAARGTHALVRRALGHRTAATATDAHEHNEQDDDEQPQQQQQHTKDGRMSTSATESFAAALLTGARAGPSPAAALSSSSSSRACGVDGALRAGSERRRTEAVQRRTRHARWARRDERVTRYYGELQHPCCLQCAGCCATRRRRRVRAGGVTPAAAASTHAQQHMLLHTAHARRVRDEGTVAKDSDDGGGDGQDGSCVDCTYCVKPAVCCVTQLRSGCCVGALLSSCPWHHSSDSDATCDRVRDVCAESLLTTSHTLDDDDDDGDGVAADGEAALGNTSSRAAAAAIGDGRDDRDRQPRTRVTVRQRLQRSCGAVMAMVQLFADLVTDMLECNAALRDAFVAAIAAAAAAPPAAAMTRTSTRHTRNEGKRSNDNNSDDDDVEAECTRRQCALLQHAIASLSSSSSLLMLLRVSNAAAATAATTATSTTTQPTLLLATPLSFALCAAHDANTNSSSNMHDTTRSYVDDDDDGDAQLLRDVQHLWGSYVNVVADGHVYRDDVVAVLPSSSSSSSSSRATPLLCLSPLLTRVVLDMAHAQLTQSSSSSSSNDAAASATAASACSATGELFVRCAAAVLRRRLRDCERVVVTQTRQPSALPAAAASRDNECSEHTAAGATPVSSSSPSLLLLEQLRWAPVLLLRDCVLLQHVEAAVTSHSGDGAALLAAVLSRHETTPTTATAMASRAPSLLLVRLLMYVHSYSGTSTRQRDNRRDDDMQQQLLLRACASAAPAHAASAATLTGLHTAWCAIHHTLTLVTAALQQLHAWRCDAAVCAHNTSTAADASMLRGGDGDDDDAHAVSMIAASSVALLSFVQTTVLHVAQGCSDAVGVLYEDAWRTVTGTCTSSAAHAYAHHTTAAAAATTNNRVDNNSNSSSIQRATAGDALTAAAAAAARARRRMPVLSPSCMHSLLNALLLQSGVYADWLRQQQHALQLRTLASPSTTSMCMLPSSTAWRRLYTNAYDTDHHDNDVVAAAAATATGTLATGGSVGGGLVRALLLASSPAVRVHSAGNDTSNKGTRSVPWRRDGRRGSVAASMQRMRRAQHQLLRVSMSYVTALHEHSHRLRTRETQLQRVYMTRGGSHGDDADDADDVHPTYASTAAALPHTPALHTAAHARRRASAAAHTRQTTLQPLLTAPHTLPLLDCLLPVGSSCVGAAATAALLRQQCYCGRLYTALRWAAAMVYTCRVLRHAAAQPLPRLVHSERLVRRRVWSSRAGRKRLVTMRVSVPQLVYTSARDTRRGKHGGDGGGGGWRAELLTRYMNELRSVQMRYGGSDGKRSRDGDDGDDADMTMRTRDSATTQALQPFAVVYEVDECVVTEVLRVALCVGAAGQRLADSVRDDCARGAVYNVCPSRTLPVVTRAALREYVYMTVAHATTARHTRGDGSVSSSVDDNNDGGDKCSTPATPTTTAAADAVHSVSTTMAVVSTPYAWHVVCALPRLHHTSAHGRSNSSGMSLTTTTAAAMRVAFTHTHYELLLTYTPPSAPAIQHARAEALLRRYMQRLARPAVLFVRQVQAMQRAHTRARALFASHTAWTAVMRVCVGGGSRGRYVVRDDGQATTGRQGQLPCNGNDASAVDSNEDNNDNDDDEAEERVWSAVLLCVDDESQWLLQQRQRQRDTRGVYAAHALERTSWPQTLHEVAAYIGLGDGSKDGSSEADVDNNKLARTTHLRSSTSDSYTTLLLQCMTAQGQRNVTAQVTMLWHVCAATLLGLPSGLLLLQRKHDEASTRHAAQHALYTAFTTAVLLQQQPPSRRVRQTTTSTAVTSTRTRTRRAAATAGNAQQQQQQHTSTVVHVDYIAATVKALLLCSLFTQDTVAHATSHKAIWRARDTARVRGFDHFLRLQLALYAQVQGTHAHDKDMAHTLLTHALTQHLLSKQQQDATSDGSTTNKQADVHSEAMHSPAWQLYTPLLRSSIIATLWLQHTFMHPSATLLAWLATHIDAQDKASCDAFATYNGALASAARQRRA